jgi:hypothetical protein
MKWLMVLAILAFTLYQLRKALVRHRVLGPVFRVLLSNDTPSRRMTAREYARGSLLFFAFAALAGACHFGLEWLGDNVSWASFSSPLAAAFVTTSLWVAGIALVLALLTLVEAVRRFFVDRKTAP